MQQFGHFQKLVNQAKYSKTSLFLLNRILWFAIPFNKRHKFSVVEITDDSVRTCARRKRKNLNHINGVHACAIATIAEFASGIILLAKLDPSKYRLIMSKLEVEYHYQAKTDIFATASLTSQQQEDEVTKPLEQKEAILKIMEVFIYDTKDNLVATARMTWQIKLWSAVKTRV